MLIMCLFSLSAILAPVLIAIYILQPFTLGKEPTLMVPNWQNGAVKRLTICCLLRGAWSALQPVCARVCICVPARVRVVCRGAGGPAPWCACVVRACAGVAREAGEREAGVPSRPSDRKGTGLLGGAQAPRAWSPVSLASGAQDSN
uniref:Uncharacterized protein n=1 Tax=Sus scrofa TaxID=9823 RepID=A0A4X1TMK9_PIG